MSEPVSALNKTRFDGAALIEDCGLQGMITLRGKLSDRTLRAGTTKAAGVKMPNQGMANIKGDCGLCWMSPDELLVLCPYDKVHDRLSALNDQLGDTFALAVNVSDARVLLRVSGPHPAAREVLAKLCPVDLSPDTFKPGMFRRTRMAQVPVAFWIDQDHCFHIIAFRAAAQYVYGLLKSAAQKSAEVGYFAAD